MTIAANMRRRASLGLALAAVALGLAATPAFAEHAGIDRYIGNAGNGSLGGQLKNPRGVAISTAPGHVGEVYVTEGDNERVQRFASDGSFQLAWGADVVASGPGNSPDGRFEICVAADGDVCKAAVESGGNPSDNLRNGALFNPQGIAIDNDTGNVYVFDLGNYRVNQYDADGAFIRSFGAFDLVAPGSPGDTGTGYEVCNKSASSICKAGETGNGVGQIGLGVGGGTGLGTSEYVGIATSPSNGSAATGFVFIVDPVNHRILRFDLDGTSPVSIGSATQFSCKRVQPSGFTLVLAEPKHIAVDTEGTVYAGGCTNLATQDPGIQRFDSGGAPLPPITDLLGTDPEQVQTNGLEIDPGDDQLFVNRGLNTLRAVQEFDTSTSALVANHLFSSPPLPFESQDLAVDGGNGEIYIPSNSAPFPGGVPGNVVLIADDDGSPPPAVQIGQASDVGPSEAVLSGTVTPNGPLEKSTPAGYQFELSRNGTDWTVLSAFNEAGTGVLSVPVTETATGLSANTLYRVRLTAIKAFGGPRAVSPEVTFLTDAIPPEATTMPIHSYTDTGAWLAGTVRPNGSLTTYHFEWGKTTAYGNRVPFPAGSAGLGHEARAFQAKLEDLDPETTYHYRVVAASEEGTVFGADRMFTTRAPFEGFVSRAFEQVSPVEKGGRDIGGLHDLTGSATLPASRDGNTVLLAAMHALGDQDWGGDIVWTDYRAVRASDGWELHGTRPRPSNPVIAAYMTDVVAGPQLEFSALSALVQVTSEPAPDGGIYLHRSLTNETSLVAQRSETFLKAAAMAEDGNHVLFQTGGMLVGDPTLPGESTMKVYEWTDGETRLVSRQPGTGAPFPGASGLGNAPSNEPKPMWAMSDDGDHIFFSTPMDFSGSLDPDMRVYRRSYGTTTTLVSPSKRSSADPKGPQAKFFQSATPDGQTVFFTSAELLTNDANTGPTRAGRDLYRYEIGSDTLIDVSAETNTVNGSRVTGVVGHSEDGNWIYYVALGQVKAEEGTPGKPNLYVWHDDGTANGETRFIATLSPQDQENYDGNRPDRSSRVTPDGHAAVFQSRADVTGYPNDGRAEVYIYEADENGGSGALSCVSCRPDGQPATRDARVPGSVPVGRNRLSGVLSENGSRVFFSSEEALLPQDVNGKRDAYEWEAGRLRLISSGKQPSDATFMAADATGDNLFFLTRERLVGQDVDGLLDLYDARVGGGIPSQSEPPPGEPCASGEGCKPPASSPATVPAPASSTLAGPGNVSPALNKRKKCGKGKVRRKARCIKKRRARTRKAATRGARR